MKDRPAGKSTKEEKKVGNNPNFKGTKGIKRKSLPRPKDFPQQIQEI